MSVNLYLKSSTRENPGLKADKHTNGTNGTDGLTFNGFRVSDTLGRLVIGWQLDGIIDESLSGVIEKITCHITIPKMGLREAGIYRHESAECELMPDIRTISSSFSFDEEEDIYRLKVSGQCLEDIRAIIHLVKVGKIRPEESYDGPQAGKSRQELQEEMGMVQQNLVSLQAVVTEHVVASEAVRDKLNAAGRQSQRIYAFASELFNEEFRWPWVLRRTVSEKIMAILQASD